MHTTNTTIDVERHFLYIGYNLLPNSPLDIGYDISHSKFH
jgi:hypothetical protein